MTQLSPSRPIHRLRVFSACLLSLLMFLAPMAPMAASANRTATANAEKQTERKQANVAKNSNFVSPPSAVGVTATLTDSFVDTAPADGRADAGSIVTYTATITNSTGADITGVSFTDTISPYTTLIGGSVKVSPLAFADAYNATVGTPLTVVAPGVLTNDTGTPAPTAIAIAAGPTTAGGSVTLNANGSFTYNPPASPGPDSFSYTITNGQAPDATATVAINVAASCPTITVTNPATNTGTVNAAFSQTFTQSGGVGTITWSKTGTLPTGITLNSSTGVLSGTPTQSGSFPITVTATDGNGCTGTGATYTLTISCQTITVTNPATNTGTVGTAFSQTFTQTGGVGTITWSETGALPTGITLNSSTGVLSGTPTQTGSFPITVTATDSNGCAGTGATYTLTINCQTITVTNPATTTGTAGTAFSQTFTQTGGIGTITWSTASTLPTGITLNSSTGVLSGTPTQTGSFPIVAKATDSNGCLGTGATYTLVIGCQSITVTNPGVNAGTAGSAFSQQFTQSNGIGTITWSETGALPSGITLNSSTGVLSGTTNQTGSFPITVKATDANGCFGTGSTYTLTMGCQSITVTNPGVNTGTAGTAFSQQFTASGILGTATWSETGTLPTGITLNSSTGVLSGTTSQVGSFPITVKATDTNGCFNTSSYTLTIACQSITVTNPGVNTGTVDAAFSQTFTPSGILGTATWSETGALPSGITLNSATGVLSGTPGQPGSFPITVKVTDSNGCFGTSSYTLTIACQTITVTNPVTTTGTVDAAFSQTFTQTGVGTHTPATFTTASTLPSGLTLSTAGVLSGTPSQPGTFPIVVTVTDANGCTGTGATYTLVIACQVITVTNPGVALATYNTAFSQTFTGTGLSHTPLTWTVDSGTLPAGLTLNSSTGALTGTPTQTGTFPITVKVTDVNGCNGTSSTYNLKVQPKLGADAYTTVGNTQFFITGIAGAPTTPAVSSGTTLLANDTADVAITTSTGTAPTLGVITYDSVGRFIYTPNAGATGSDVFTYSGTANGVTATATITVTINNRVWYVNSSGSNGDGRSNTPFNTMTGADTAANAVGDYIFVHTGGATTTGNISLLASQTLWGQGSTFTLGPLTIASGTKPTLTGTVTLGGNNDTVSSLDISSGASTGITNTAGITGALVTNNVTVATTSGTGVSFNGIAGTLTFTGLTSTAGAGANLTGSNGSATFNFSNVTISSATNAGFTSTGGGTLVITGAANTIASTTGTALNVANTTIGASGLTFRSINVDGNDAAPTNGIILNNTGSSGGLTVTGTGSAGTGGTIQDTSGNAVQLTTTEKLSLSWMNITSNLGSGIGGSGINGFQLANCSITSNGDNAATDDSGINVTQLTGTASAGARPTSITNCTIQNNWEFQIQITNTSGTLTDLTMSGNTISTTAASGVSGNLFNFLGGGTSVMKLTVTSGNFTGNWTPASPIPGPSTVSGTAISGVTQGTTHTVNVSGATFTNNNAGVDCSTSNVSTTFNCNVSNNNFQGSRAVAINSFHNGNSPFTRTFNGTFSNNIIGTSGNANSASYNGRAIDISNEGAITTANYTISGNTISEVGVVSSAGAEAIGVNVGLGGLATGGGSTQVTITGNSISNIRNSRALIVSDNQDPAFGPFPSICANISGNTITGTIAGQAGNGQYMRVKEGSGTVRVTQAAVTTVSNVAELDDANGFNDNPAGSKFSQSGTPLYSQAACTGSTAQYRPENKSKQQQYLARASSDDLFVSPRNSAALHAQSTRRAMRTDKQTTANQAQATSSVASAALAQRSESGESGRSSNQAIARLNSTNDRASVATSLNHSSVTKVAPANHTVTTTALTRTAHRSDRAALADKPVTPFSGETVNVTIGTIPAGKSVTITFQVQLNASMPFGTSTVTTQGTVTYTAGPPPIANGEAGSSDLSPNATVLTDDPGASPDTGPSDPTVTPIDAPTASGSTVSGQILDPNGVPIEGAAVRMTGTQNRLTVTDASGFYHFDDVETNGFYTVVPARSNFSFSPSQRAFSQLGQHTDAVFVGSSTGTTANPLDTTEYFVRQQYVDFLGREPDEAGLGFWVNNIESCGNDAQCRAGKRIDTSAAFFLSIEFQKTGYLAYRTYQAAFGDLPGAPVPVGLGNFKSDQAMIAKDVIVNSTGWETKLDDNEAAFMADFVSRAPFTAAYPTTLSPDAFVSQLFAHAGVTPTEGDRTAAVSEFGSATDTANTAARGRALQRVAENAALQQQEFTQAFVLMQYFGYLRRDPNTGADTDYSGYAFWLGKLNNFNGDFGNAEMVKSFLVSTEYRGRFPK